MTAAERLPNIEAPDHSHVIEAPAVKVMILGKAQCGKCDAAKKKLSEFFNMDFEFVELENPKNWRNTDAVAVLASAQIKGIDHNHPPVIGVNGEAFEYAAAMKQLKALLA